MCCKVQRYLPSAACCMHQEGMPTTRGALLQLAACNCRFDAVVHFAGRKAVGESVEFPMLYYTHNVVGTVNLIEAMRKHGIKNVRPARSSLPLLHDATLRRNPTVARPWRRSTLHPALL